MSEDVVPTGLTPEQERAAELDARGESRPAIAKACDVTPKTITSWRKKPLYVDERKRVAAELASELDARTRATKTALLDGIGEAIQSLRNALEAERDDGSPEWGTRTRAAEALLGKAKFVYEGEDNDASAPQAAVIVVNLGNDGSPEVIEGHATE